jgi:iron(III) transport system permease protein
MSWPAARRPRTACYTAHMRTFVCGIALLALLVLALLPVGLAVARSFQVDGEWSLEHYATAFGSALAAESAQRQMLLNTLALGSSATLLALVLGLPYAFLTARTDLPGRAGFVAVYLLPILVPPLIASIAWVQLTAWTNDWTGRTFRDGYLFGGLPGSAFVFGMCYLPFVILFARRALLRVPASLEEAGTLAVGRWRTWRRIVLPLALPGILAGAVFVFVFTICDFAVVDYLNTYNIRSGGNYFSFRVYPIVAFSKWTLGRETELATALGAPLTLLAFVGMGLALHLRRRGDAALLGATWREPPTVRLGWARWPASLFCLLVLALSFGAPVGTLLAMSGSAASYRTILTDRIDEIGFTVGYAALAASFATILAFVLAWIAARMRRGFGSALELLVFVPLVFPPILLGFGLWVTWKRVPAVSDGIALAGTRILVPLILITLLVKYLPFPFAAIVAHLRGIERSQEEAAAVSGVSWGQRMWGILVPLASPAIAAGWILAFVFCLREIDTLAILTGVRSTMFSIYTLIHTSQDDLVAALCVVQIALLGLPFLLYGLLAWRRLRVL